MKVTMLTTIDNPYDPFEDFDRWNAFDIANGYHSCAYVDRIANTSFDMSDEDETLAIENAIDEILKLNVLGIYKKVVKEVKDKESK